MSLTSIYRRVRKVKRMPSTGTSAIGSVLEPRRVMA
jgi:hypothetical protein